MKAVRLADGAPSVIAPSASVRLVKSWPARKELSIVTDVDEWAHFKRQHGLTSPLERNFMEEGGREIYLSARETVYIPFTLRSNHCGPRV